MGFGREKVNRRETLLIVSPFYFRGRIEMKLESIGFYTLSDERAKNASSTSQLMRGELILTDVCNFKCSYCKGLRSDVKETMSLARAKEVIDLWAREGLKNIRLSGGEPTIWPDLVELVWHARLNQIKNIAISTNGSADMSLYKDLINAGVNDFSISLDACCSAFGDVMSGGIVGSWDKVVSNIKEIAKLSYTTLGVVVTEETVADLNATIEFADSLGVSDIRIISAAQYNQLLNVVKTLNPEIYLKYPILQYRILNLLQERNVRGIQLADSSKCGLVLDDMAIAGNYHFPCIIYMREGGDPIGKIGQSMRQERLVWSDTHDTHTDPICSKNCLDVCIDYNNTFRQGNKVRV